MKTPEEIKRDMIDYMEDASCVTEYGDAHDLIDSVEKGHATMAAALAYIRQLEQRVPRWISVHDALPGMDEKVLFIPACNPRSVYIGKLKYVGEVNAVYFVVNNWRRTVTYSATHWMPRPKTLEEDANES